MAKKCNGCEFLKTYADKKGVNDRLFTMVCTKNFPKVVVVDMYETKINKEEFEALECISEKASGE